MWLSVLVSGFTSEMVMVQLILLDLSLVFLLFCCFDGSVRWKLKPEHFNAGLIVVKALVNLTQACITVACTTGPFNVFGGVEKRGSCLETDA